MKHLRRPTTAPSFESMTRAALKQMTREQILAAKFAEDVIAQPTVRKVVEEPKIAPMTFSLGSLFPTTL